MTLKTISKPEMVVEGIAFDHENMEFSLAWDLVNHTSKSLFLTGKAGSGKTTFLKFLKKYCNKKMVIVAPTGVAAVNAGGVTIHSFFKIPFPAAPFYPSDPRLQRTSSPGDPQKHTIFSYFRYNRDQLKLLSEIELLVIDEVSMVRCDLLDAIDRILRILGRKDPHMPFGGVQTVFLGDPFQIPPVARGNDKHFLKRFYPSRHFFSSNAYQELNPLYIELQKIYRQNDLQFIDLLNQIRVNQVSPATFRQLNSLVDTNYRPPKNSNTITLATHNKVVKTINQQELKLLEAPLMSFEGEVIGKYPDSLKPAPQTLQLKIDAQVMFIKNGIYDGVKCFNGKIGKVIGFEEGSIRVQIELGQEINLERVEWINLKYEWDEESKSIQEEELGRYRQFPLKLAWAISVHKSQGLTFERVFADLGNAFDSGQVYVALSRCTSLQGLKLRSSIPPSAIVLDPEILAFAKNKTSLEQAEALLLDHKVDLLYESSRQAFKNETLELAYDLFLEAHQSRDELHRPSSRRYFLLLLRRLIHSRTLYHKEHLQRTKVSQHLNRIRTKLALNKKVSQSLQEQVERLDHQNLILEQELRRMKKGKKILQSKLAAAEEEIAQLQKTKAKKGFWQKLFQGS